MYGYDWNFSVLAPFMGAFVRGTYITIALSVISFTLGSIVGIAAGAAFRAAPGARLIFLLNDCLRAIPLLVMLFLVYFFPTKEIFGVSPPSPFWSAVIAFAIIQAAFTADVIRSAIDQVPQRAILAGHAIGLTARDLWRFVILPDILRQVAPAQIAFFIGTVRLSSLASVIGVQDVVFVSRAISAQTFRSLEPWLVVAAIYIVLVVPLTVIAREFEHSKWLKRRA
jgi:polar amino acid transport system permease protein